MISHFFNIDFREVEDLWVSEYNALLEQSQNLANLYIGGKFSFLDSKDKREDFINEIEYFKSQGRLN